MTEDLRAESLHSAQLSQHSDSSCQGISENNRSNCNPSSGHFSIKHKNTSDMGVASGYLRDAQDAYIWAGGGGAIPCP